MSDPLDRGPERKEGLLGRLSVPPTRMWPDAVLHHGARILLLVLLASLIAALFPPVARMQVSRFSAGMVADESIIARVPFAVPKSEEELTRGRDEARDAVPPTFVYRPEAADSMASRLERFFVRIDSLNDGAPGEVRDFLEESSIGLTSDQIQTLRDGPTLDLIRSTALQAARQILPERVADRADLQNYGTSTITVREGPETERSVSRSEVLDAGEFYDRAVELLPPATPPDVQQILRLVLIQFLEYSLELDIQATESNREGAARAVATTKRDVLQGEAIVRANEAITESALEELEAYEETLRNRGMLEEEGLDPTPLVGAGLVNLLVLSVFGVLLYFFRNETYTNFRWVVLMAVLVAAYFAAAGVIAANSFPWELLPIAFVALAVAVLWDGRMALVLVMILSVLTVLQPPFQGASHQILAVTLLGGAAAAMSVRAVRRRAQTWVFSAIIAGAYLMILVGLTLTGQLPAADFPASLGWATANAVLSAILAMGFLPVFEFLTGITTDQTLLEWADPNRPLLRRLSMEAPGTYAHTINVANLAEAAANGVGANGLLCRVGLYYHDIGKMLKPHYFVENQPDGRNPHDRLKPDTSAAIVKEHVTEGYKLARGENVPDLIADFIPEHHGTQRIGFFWEKAREEYGEESLDPADFTYPGPRPRSKETAIAMLADSVESATRVLQDPTPDRVRGLIENIVDAKVADGQLDESPLTLREIRQIKEQFIKVLSGIYHHRIDYPQTKHLTDKGSDGSGEDGGGATGEEEAEGDAAATPAPAAPAGAAGEAGPEAPAEDEDARQEAPVAGNPANPGRPPDRPLPSEGQQDAEVDQEPAPGAPAAPDAGKDVQVKPADRPRS